MPAKITIRCSYCKKVKTARKSQYWKPKRYCNATCYQKSIKKWKPTKQYWGSMNENYDHFVSFSDLNS